MIQYSSRPQRPDSHHGRRERSRIARQAGRVDGGVRGLPLPCDIVCCCTAQWNQLKPAVRTAADGNVPPADRTCHRRVERGEPGFRSCPGDFLGQRGPAGPAWTAFSLEFLSSSPFRPQLSRPHNRRAAAARRHARGARSPFRTFSAALPPPRDPNGLRNVQHFPLFSAFCCQNWLQTLRTSDVGTIDRR